MKLSIYTKLASLMVIFALFMSCETIFDSSLNNATDDDCDNYDFSDCDGYEPKEAALVIKLTINEENKAVPIAVYRGNLEDNILFVNDTAFSSEHKIYVPLNRFYTVTAMYKSGIKTIIAVDGDKINKTSRISCDSTCWEVSGGNINVKLKY